MKKSFGTALNCIDGRVQIPVINWIKENFNLDYIDLITEPGMDKVLSQGDYFDIFRLRDKVNISIEAHKSTIIAIIGHYDCAANPVNKKEHYKQIEEATEIVKNWNLPVRAVVGLWVDELWKVQVVRAYKRIKC